MDRIFDYEDAKRLCASHKQILDTIRRTLSAREKDNNNFAKAAAEAYKSKVITSQVMTALQTGNLNIQTQPNEKALLHAAYVLAEGEKITEALQVKEKGKREILRDITALSGASSPMKWFFSGKESKKAANAAYRRLSEMIQGNYPVSVSDLEKQSKKLDAVSVNEAYAAVLGNEHTYVSLLAKYISDLVQKDNLPPEIARRIRVVTDTVSKYQAAQANQKTREQQAKTEANEAIRPLISERTMQELRKQDLGVLSQRRSGIRIKALRDRGYRNLADIQAASYYQLASVYGISQDAARVIKVTANEIAQEIARTIKLKISSDERTPAATALLKAACKYDLIKNAEKMLSPEVKKRLEEAGKNTAYLSTLKNNLCWEFSNSVQKNRYIQSYQAVEKGLSSSVIDAVQQYNQLIMQNRAISDAWVWTDFEQRSIEYFNLLEDLCPGVFGNDDLLYGLPEDLAREIQDQVYFPQGLKVTLRRYQEWGVKYILHQERVLLGDEMGLGKTVQAIAAMVSLRNTGAKKFLVVCPASVLPNWCKEIDKKSEFHSIKVHGYGRQAAFDSWAEMGGVAVTTYETLSTLKLPIGLQFDLLVVDEAHFIKNESAQRSQYVRMYGTHTNRLLYMTGTALENKVEEMISLLQVLNPKVAGEAQRIAFMSTAPQFRQKIAPVYYRRKREDVLTELPAITYSKEWCDLLPEEYAAYKQAVMAKDRTNIRRVSWNMEDPGKSAKVRRLKEIVEEAESDNRKVLVFSFYLETIGRVIEVLGRRCTQPINGSVPVQRRQQIIDEFERMPAGSVLPAQIQAGGTGLNIQSASVVIICEPQLKPSVENQAISRAYRMGQTRKVLVYRLLASNTIDERVDDMLTEKQAIFDAFADISEAANATEKEEQQIDDKTFGKLIQEEIDRINAAGGKMPPPMANKSPEQAKPKATIPQPPPQRSTPTERPAPVYQVPTRPIAQTRAAAMPVQKETQRPNSAPVYQSPTRPGTSSTNTRTTRPGASVYKEQPMIRMSSENKTTQKTPDIPVYKARPMVSPPPVMNMPQKSAEPARKGVVVEKNVTINKPPTFSRIEDFMAYASRNGVPVIDNREKGGCIWIASDPRFNTYIENMIFGDRGFKYSAKSKALGGKPGWYY